MPVCFISVVIEQFLSRAPKTQAPIAAPAEAKASPKSLEEKLHLNVARLKVIAALPVNEYDQSVEDEVRAMVLATNEGQILKYEA